MVNPTAESLRQNLKTVADAEHGNVEVENCRVENRRAFFVDTARATRENDRQWLLSGNLAGSYVVMNNFGIDTSLTNPAGNQLGILSAKINNEDWPINLAPLVLFGRQKIR